jgi:hypothetical protein
MYEQIKSTFGEWERMVFSIFMYLKDLLSSSFNLQPTMLWKEVAKACGISEWMVSWFKAEAEQITRQEVPVSHY